MLQQIVGGALVVSGFFMLALGPYDRLQIAAFTNLMRLVGLALMVAGALLLKG